MMKKMFAVVVLVSAAVVACGGKKANTTPATPMETNSTGGAAYGGAGYGGGVNVHKDAPPAGKDTPNPCASK